MNQAKQKQRQRFGISGLDDALGGGLIPGTLTMIVGATGVGKTQLGMHFCQTAEQQEGQRGAIVDLSSRGDSQNHSDYYSRLFGESLSENELKQSSVEEMFGGERPGDLLLFLGYGGRRVLRSQMDADDWHSWQSELNRRMPMLSSFVYRHLLHGTRRFLVDGIEPQGKSDDSMQLDLLEFLYHRMLRQEHDWLAREVLRQAYREHQEQVFENAYDHGESTAVVLVTTRHAMLEQLMTEPLTDGDLAAGANTVIMLGRQLHEGKMMRAMYIAKHRGSFADQRILPFEVTEAGIVMTEA